MKHRKYTELELLDKIVKARKLRAEGISINEISNFIEVRNYYLVKSWINDVLTPLDIKNIYARELCQETNFTFKKIASLVEVNHQTIISWCKNIKRPLSEMELKKHKAIELCVTTSLTYVDIGREVGANEVSVSIWCRDIKRPPSFYDTKREFVIELWENTTFTGAQISDKVEVSRPSVFKWTKGRSRPERIHPKRAQVRQICRETWWGYKHIAELFDDVSPWLVKTWCKDIERAEDSRIAKARLLYETTIMTQAEIAAELGVGPRQIGAWCEGIIKFDPLTHIKAKAKELCANTDWTYKEIAAYLGVSLGGTIQVWCREIRPPKRRVRSGGGMRTPEQLADVKEQVRDLWQNSELPVRRIAKQLGVATRSVRMWSEGLERPGLSQRERYDLKKAEAQRLARTTKMSFKDIADQIEASSAAVRGWCRGIRPKGFKPWWTTWEPDSHRCRKLRRRR